MAPAFLFGTNDTRVASLITPILKGLIRRETLPAAQTNKLLSEFDVVYASYILKERERGRECIPCYSINTVHVGAVADKILSWLW